MRKAFGYVNHRIENQHTAAVRKDRGRKLLQQIQNMLHKHFHTPIDELGGQTLQEFNDEMDEAEAEIDAGEFYTHDEVVAKINKLFAK